MRVSSGLLELRGSRGEMLNFISFELNELL
jgi:hypothetical protein